MKFNRRQFLKSLGILAVALGFSIGLDKIDISQFTDEQLEKISQIDKIELIRYSYMPYQVWPPQNGEKYYHYAYLIYPKNCLPIKYPNADVLNYVYGDIITLLELPEIKKDGDLDNDDYINPVWTS